MKEHASQDEYNPHLKALILQIVENQIAGQFEDGQPLTAELGERNYVKETFDRLSVVHGPAKAKEMIAAVLLTEIYDVMKHQKAFDEARYRTRLEELEEISTMEESGLSTEIKELMHSYFAAFANLYGIIPLYRALRIIRKQNPALSLTEEEFLSFVNEVEQEDHFYIIAGAEDIYIDVNDPTPPLKREIIAEYLYAVDDFDSYDELRAKQGDKPFYIPEKELLLKYQDDLYLEEAEGSLALGAFLRDKVKLKRADDVLDELRFQAHMETTDPQEILWEVERMAGKGCLGSIETINEFFRYYFVMYNNTRIASNRGFTPREMQELPGGPPHPIEFGSSISRFPQKGGMGIGELPREMIGLDIPISLGSGVLNNVEMKKQKKPGRNDPCPCGSGKKYKLCCGR